MVAIAQTAATGRGCTRKLFSSLQVLGVCCLLLALPHAQLLLTQDISAQIPSRRGTNDQKGKCYLYTRNPALLTQFSRGETNCDC